MGVIEAPQWLVPAFVRSAKAIGANAPLEQIETVGEGLVASWSSPDRFHHAIKHRVDVLASIDQLAEETHDPDVVRIAGWYHGAEFCSNARASYGHRGGDHLADGQGPPADPYCPSGERELRPEPGLHHPAGAGADAG